MSHQSDLMLHLRELGSRQYASERSVINLIASDNAYPLWLANNPPYKGHMIQEGLRGARPFAGAVIHDEIEAFAEMLTCDIFDAESANLQPHSCSQANQAAYQALLTPGDTVLALNFRAGGHLTHGLSTNFSGRQYRFNFYGTLSDGRIDYDELRKLALTKRPRLIVCGSSSYPRLFDAKTLRSIADDSGARLMFDLSHEAGLIAGKAIGNPVPWSDVTTMSLDKTLRGPFGGIILCRRELAGVVNRAIHPGTQSSFPIRKLTDSAHALLHTKTPEFRVYAESVLLNAKILASTFTECGITLLTGGTDKHYIVADVSSAFGLTGLLAEQRLESISILSSRQTIPLDTSNRGQYASGLRLGTAWVTSRGYRPSEIKEVAQIIVSALRTEGDSTAQKELGRRVKELAMTARANDVWN